MPRGKTNRKGRVAEGRTARAAEDAHTSRWILADMPGRALPDRQSHPPWLWRFRTVEMQPRHAAIQQATLSLAFESADRVCAIAERGASVEYQAIIDIAAPSDRRAFNRVQTFSWK